LILSISVTDPATGYPGQTVGILGELEINSLPQVAWGSLPPVLDLVTVEGFVTGLTPGAEYFLFVEHNEEARIIDENSTWLAAAVTSPSNAEPVSVFWSSRWQRPWPVQRLQARIEGTPPSTNLSIHYDNLNDPGFFAAEYPDDPYRHVKFGPDTPGGGVAQMFTAGGSGTVTSVTMGLARLEEPGGKLILSIREVTALNLPGEIVGLLGEIEVNSLQEVIWENLPAKLETETINGLVEGLTPGEDYFLVVEDQDAISDATRGWVASAAETPEGADPVLADWGPGGWLRPWEGPDPSRPFGAVHLVARIEGRLSAPELNIERAVQISWPESEGTGILERASSPEGPWEPVTEPVQTVDGVNRVTITSANNAYFRLRSE
jgi:hypothetical protein